jgi:MFS family permease
LNEEGKVAAAMDQDAWLQKSEEILTDIKEWRRAHPKATFIEPQMMFYVYNQLLLTPTQLGILVGGNGLVMLAGQAGPGQLSDRYGRKPLIVLGLLLNFMLYPGLIFLKPFSLLFLVAVLAGIGSALVSPALSATYLDIAEPQHQ